MDDGWEWIYTRLVEQELELELELEQEKMTEIWKRWGPPSPPHCSYIGQFTLDYACLARR